MKILPILTLMKMRSTDNFLDNQGREPDSVEPHAGKQAEDHAGKNADYI